MSVTKHFSSRAARMQPAAIRAVLAQMTAETIPFAAGKPAQHLFPLDAIYQQTGAMLEKHGGDVLQYSGTAGFLPLREWLAAQTPPATADQVCLAAGSAQAIDLVGKVFIDEGDKVAVEAPTYTAALSALKVYGPEFIAVDGDADGMVLASLEAALVAGAKLIYVIPNFANPSGVCMTQERREGVIALAKRFEVPILEDDPYGELRFSGDPLPNLFEMWPEGVIYCSSFSKIVAPGMRVAWMIAAPELISKLTIAKQVTDLQVGTYQQMLLHYVVQSIDFAAHLEEVRGYYGRQCQVMLDAMGQHFPAGICYDRPAGGMFIFCRLPDGYNALEILHEAMRRDVAFVPGESFFADERGANTFRLSYSLASEAQINEGIAILGALFREVLSE